MALTRVQVEKILVKRTGKLLAMADLDGTTINGTNPDLNDPIGWALRKLGYAVADPTAVADSDLDDVPAGKYDAVFDLAELRTLQNILGNLDKVNSTVGPRREEYDNLRKGLLQTIPLKRSWAEREHGINLGELKDASFEVL